MEPYSAKIMFAEGSCPAAGKIKKEGEQKERSKETELE